MDLGFTINEIDWSITKDVFPVIGTVGALIIGGLGLMRHIIASMSYSKELEI